MAKKILGGLIGGVAGLLGMSMKKKQVAEAQVPVPTPNRNFAAEQAAKNDLAARRRGVLANALNLGAGGAEASVGGKSKLGQ